MFLTNNTDFTPYCC